MSRFNLAIATLLSFCSAAIAAFDASSNSNVAIYWGQGPSQARLVETCMNPNVDIVIVAFVNVFPDNEGSGGYPGTNFGNACGAPTYTNSTGGATQLLSDCPYIGPDITTCQSTYGKKVFLSLGGAYPLNYFIGNKAQAVDFAEFLWGAFGPVTSAWTSANKPRPFGNAVIDGFDFDIESEVSPPPTWNGKPVKNYMTRGYAKMINTFKTVLFPQDTSKSYYISGAPQCVVPDAHLGKVVTHAWFDFLFIQFYNTPYCSARTGVDYIHGNTTENISYDTWADVAFYNPNVKLYIGLPASTTASGMSNYYLPPADAKTLLSVYVSHAKFGGVMLWEATYAANNVICGKNYPTWIKRILKAVSHGKKINTSTNDCPDSGETCGTCPDIKVTKNGNCGANYGRTCSGSIFGSCCTSDGTCSSSSSDCSSSCDPQFSDCSNSGRKLKFKRQVSFPNTTTSAVVSLSTSAGGGVGITGGVSTDTSTTISIPSSLPSGLGDAISTSVGNITNSNVTSTSSSSVALGFNATTTVSGVTADPLTQTTSTASAPSIPAAVSPTNDDPTVVVSSSTYVETLYQTVFITTVVEEVTSTITLVEPVTTETIVVDVTITPNAAQAAPAGVTVTTVTTVITEHITIKGSPPADGTQTLTDYTTVNVEYNTDAPRTSTITLNTTTTVTSTITIPAAPTAVSNATTFANSTVPSFSNTTVAHNVSTVLQYVTLVPIAADEATHTGGGQKKIAATAASVSPVAMAVASASPSASGLVQYSTGGAAREAGPWAPLAVVVGLCFAVVWL